MRALASGRGLHNVPAELTSFVGRRRELDEIRRLFKGARLVTLTGPGGVGKTRLARQAASEMARAFTDGVWLIELAPIGDPQLVTQAVLRGLGLQDISAGWTLSRLTDYLAAKQLLLVLDNCEHLLDSCAVLAVTLLRSCPGLRMLVTSREALAVTGENRLPIPPLSLPTEGEHPTAKTVGGYEAVRLLTERAAAVLPGFAIDEANAPVVLGLCRSLDGIPLALELAAVRLGSLSLEQLANGLKSDQSVLDEEIRGADPRQQTLEATIGWSHRLLNERERLLWARLSIFAGGFDEAAMKTVCAGSDLTPETLTKVLASLVDKSIVQRNIHSLPVRYSMLEAVRQYGRRRLRELGEEYELGRRHRDWIRDLARVVSAHDHREAEAFDRTAQDLDNVWSALDFCRREQGGAALGAEICRRLYLYWYSRGPLGDVRRIVDAFYAQAPDDSRTRGWCDFTSSALAALQNDPPVAQSKSEEMLRIGHEIGDDEMIGWGAGAALTTALYVQASTDEGLVTLIETLIESARSLDQWFLEPCAMSYLCRLRLSQGNLEAAVEAGEAGAAMCREHNELFVRGAVLNNLAEAKRRLGQLDEAEVLAKEGAAGQHALDSRRGLSQLVETLAWMAGDRGAATRAAILLGYAERLRQSIMLALPPLHRPRHDVCEQSARSRLGDAAYTAASQKGASMPDVEAIAFVLEQPVAPIGSGVAPLDKATSPIRLTKREQEIATLVAEGLSNKQIAVKLVVSERTAESHIFNILNKLGFNSRAQIASWAAAHQPAAAVER